MAVIINIVSRFEDRGFRRAQKELTKFAHAATLSQRSLAGSMIRTGGAMRRQGKAMSAFGASATRNMTVPIVALGALAVKAAADFDASMTEALAIMGKVGPGMRRQLEQTAKVVATKTTFTATEAAKAYYFLTSAGLDATQSMAALPGVAKFAQAGVFDLSTATSMLADSQAAMGMASKDATVYLKNQTRIADVLTKANVIANGSVEQFAEALTNKAAAGLRQTNKSVEEGVAVLATFADQGLKGVAAGQALYMVLRDLQKASQEQPAAWKKIGVSVYDAAGKMRAMPDIIQDLEHELMGLTDENKRAQIAALGFTDRGLAPLLSLLGQSDKIRGYQKELEKATGYTNRVARKQLLGFTNQLKLLRNRLLNAGITIGTIFMPYLRKAVDYLTRGVKAFSKLSPATQKSIIKVALLSAALGPLVFILGKLTFGLGALIQTAGIFGATFKGAAASGAGGMKALSAAFGAVGLASMGWALLIVAVVAALVLLYVKCKWFRNGVNQIMGGVIKIFKAFYKAVSAIIGWIIKHWRGLLDAFLLITGPVGWVTMYVIHHFDEVKNKVAAVLKWLGNLPGLKQAISVARTICKAIAGAFGDLVGWIHDHWSAILRTIGGFVNKIGGIINKAFGWTGIKVPTVTWGEPGPPGSTGSGRKGDPSIAVPGQGDDARMVSVRQSRTGDPVTDALSWFGGTAKDVVGYLAGLLPDPPKMPGPLAGLLPALIKRIAAKIKELVGKVGIGSADLGGSGYGWAYGLARKFGLAVTSTYRPGAITAAGYVSDHATRGRAADLAGSTMAMARLWAYVKATAGSWKQAIYQHQMVNRGALGSYGPSDHFDHVHLARGGAGDDSRRALGGAPAAAPTTYVFEGCLFAQDFDAIIAEANRRGAARIRRREARTQGVPA